MLVNRVYCGAVQHAGAFLCFRWCLGKVHWFRSRWPNISSLCNLSKWHRTCDSYLRFLLHLQRQNWRLRCCSLSKLVHDEACAGGQFICSPCHGGPSKYKSKTLPETSIGWVSMLSILLGRCERTAQTYGLSDLLIYSIRSANMLHIKSKKHDTLGVGKCKRAQPSSPVESVEMTSIGSVVAIPPWLFLGSAGVACTPEVVSFLFQGFQIGLSLFNSPATQLVWFRIKWICWREVDKLWPSQGKPSGRGSWWI